MQTASVRNLRRAEAIIPANQLAAVQDFERVHPELSHSNFIEWKDANSAGTAPVEQAADAISPASFAETQLDPVLLGHSTQPTRAAVEMRCAIPSSFQTEITVDFVSTPSTRSQTQLDSPLTASLAANEEGTAGPLTALQKSVSEFLRSSPLKVNNESAPHLDLADHAALPPAVPIPASVQPGEMRCAIPSSFQTEAVLTVGLDPAAAQTQTPPDSSLAATLTGGAVTASATSSSAATTREAVARVGAPSRRLLRMAMEFIHSLQSSSASSGRPPQHPPSEWLTKRIPCLRPNTGSMMGRGEQGEPASNAKRRRIV
jgi:hypothetical protein